MTISAQMSDAVSEKMIVKPSCLKSWPLIPSIRLIGRKTTMVVMVEAMIELVTNLAPSSAAVR